MLSNAIKFTSKRGSVQVLLACINSHVEIRVSDTGPGIDEEFLPFVFDRFRQADSSASKKYGGLGLGLAIVRHLVELHGETVEAANREDIRGTVFTLKLPVVAARKPVERFGEEPEVIQPIVRETVSFDCPPQLDGIKVLAVDDEPDARILLTTILEQCGAEV